VWRYRKQAQARLGTVAPALNWIEGDVTQVELPKHHYAVWHDRAVFHFLTDQTPWGSEQRFVYCYCRKIL